MANQVKDPVCGMVVDTASATCPGDVCFCSEECRVEYTANPGKYQKT
jgi:YHS domain-containing protein